MGILGRIFNKIKANPTWKDEDFSTSLSDTKVGDYPSFCKQAASDDEIFSTFRTNPVYTRVLEHVSQQQGEEYLHIILQRGHFTQEQLKEFAKNDLYGGAMTYDYGKVGRFSPTTLRYMKVLSDLIMHFGDLNGKDICEVGIGYGGQARVIMAFFKPRSYTFIDLDSVLELGEKYLGHFGLETQLHFARFDSLGAREYDLFISNYAFSELRRNIQDVYIQKAIRGSKHGYITFNDIAPKDFNYHSSEYPTQFQKELSTHKEEPLTHPNNKIITW